MENNYGGVLQFFFHCPDEILPIRDINYKGKTEPHYENLTENWFQSCMNRRIRCLNLKQLDYLFIFTRYLYPIHKYFNRYIIVGYLKRAKPERFLRLNKSLTSGVNQYDPDNPQNCGFFAGDPSDSHFVDADGAYLLKEMKHPYQYPWLVSKYEAEKILMHLKKSKNILQELQKLTKKIRREKNESCFNTCWSR